MDIAKKSLYLFFVVTILLTQSIRVSSQSISSLRLEAGPVEMLDKAVSTAEVQGENFPAVKFNQSFGEYQVPYYDEPTHLNFPGGVAVDGERVWIAEYTGKRALLYNPDGTFVKKINRSMMYLEYVLAEISTLCDVAVAPDHTLWLSFQGTIVNVTPDGAFIRYTTGDAGHSLSYNCHGLAIDEAGRLFVSDMSYQIINVYDNSGSYLQTIGSPGGGPLELATPVNLTVKDGLLYVAETGTDRVQIMDVSNLASVSYEDSIRDFQISGVDTQLNDPSGVNVDATRIFIADTGNNRVLVFDRVTRAYLYSIGGGQGTAEDQWNKPYDIAVDASGRVYVSDMNNHRVKQFASNLAIQRIFGETGVAYKTDEKHFMYPYRIQADHQGDIYVAETRAHRVVKLAPDGTPIFSLGESGIVGSDTGHFNNPVGLAVDALDRVYVTDERNHRIMVFDQNGAFVSAFGSQGPGIDQLNFPSGVAIHPVSGDIFVADNGNARVQVYDHNWTYKTTIGITGETGSDNQHFEGLSDIAVDIAGNVYVADDGNSRAQKCVPSGINYTCSTFVGETLVKGEPFAHFQNLQGMAVDTNDLVYLVDYGLCLVYIYDTQGHFVGALGGSFLLPGDITADAAGNLYVADSMNQRIMKYSPVDQDWKRRNILKFGDLQLNSAPVLASFDDRLYAGYAHDSGAQVWSMNSAADWQKDTAASTLAQSSQAFSSTMVFANKLYLGTVNSQNAPIGGQLLQYDGANWTNVAGSGFSDSLNYAISSLAEFNGSLYAGTSRGSWANGQVTPLGAQIWRSPSGGPGDWAKVLDFGEQGALANGSVRQIIAYNAAIYALVDNWQTGSEVWRSANGSDWTRVVASGLGQGSALAISSLEVFQGYLYLGVYMRDQAAQIWRCQACTSQGDFTRVMQGGFHLQDVNRDGWIDNISITDLQNFKGYLYAWTYNPSGGSETWRTQNGTSWEQFNPYGLGLEADAYAAVTIFNGTLYAGSDSTHVWEIDPRVEVIKSGNGSGSVTSLPAGIDCGPTCSAEFPSSSLVTLTAAAAPGSTFTGWSGEGCSGTGECTVTAGQWRNVTAGFAKQAGAVTLTLQITGDGDGLVASSPAGISCGSACQYTFPSGTTVSLAALARLGAFTGWSGGCSGSGGSCQLTLSTDTTVTAAFRTHAPTTDDFQRNGIVDADLFFTPADFGAHFTDPDGDSLVRVTITSLPAQGILKYKSNPLSIGQIIAYDALDSLYYQPPAGFNGSASFTWTGNDGLYESNLPATVSLSIQPDVDGDGIGDGMESNTPPLNSTGLLGDGNGDNLVDTAQSNVTSLAYLSGDTTLISSATFDAHARTVVAGSQKYLTLEVNSPLAFVDATPMLYPSGNPPLPEPRAGFPFGFVNFIIKDITPGAAVDVILYVESAALPDRLLGYGAVAGDFKFHWYDFTFAGQTGVEVEKLANNRLKFTLHYIDGQKGDDDLTANGFIKATFGALNYRKTTFLPFIKR